MTKYHVGGFGVTVRTEGSQLFMSEPLEAAALTNRLQKDSKYPLMFAADFERGLSMRLEGATAFPAAMAFGATGDKKLARQFGRISAQESRAIGVQWNWFPDCGCQFQSRQSHHRYALVWRRSRAGERNGRGLH